LIAAQAANVLYALLVEGADSEGRAALDAELVRPLATTASDDDAWAATWRQEVLNA
jgi:hypothetical protein